MTMALLDFFKNRTVLKHEYVPPKDWLLKYTPKCINLLVANGEKPQIDDFMTFAEEHLRQRFVKVIN